MLALVESRPDLTFRIRGWPSPKNAFWKQRCWYERRATRSEPFFAFAARKRETIHDKNAQTHAYLSSPMDSRSNARCPHTSEELQSRREACCRASSASCHCSRRKHAAPHPSHGPGARHTRQARRKHACGYHTRQQLSTIWPQPRCTFSLGGATPWSARLQTYGKPTHGVVPCPWGRNALFEPTRCFLFTQLRNGVRLVDVPNQRCRGNKCKRTSGEGGASQRNKMP